MKPGYAIWFVIVNNKDLVCPDNRILLSLLNYTQKMIKIDVVVDSKDSISIF